jgi:hypothetical protein
MPKSYLSKLSPLKVPEMASKFAPDPLLAFPAVSDLQGQ